MTDTPKPPSVKELLEICGGFFDSLEEENRITCKVNGVDVRKCIQAALGAGEQELE